MISEFHIRPLGIIHGGARDASGKTVSAAGVRQSETHTDARFRAMIGAMPLARIGGYALRAFA